MHALNMHQSACFFWAAGAVSSCSPAKHAGGLNHFPPHEEEPLEHMENITGEAHLKGQEVVGVDGRKGFHFPTAELVIGKLQAFGCKLWASKKEPWDKETEGTPKAWAVCLALFFVARFSRFNLRCWNEEKRVRLKNRAWKRGRKKEEVGGGWGGSRGSSGHTHRFPELRVSQWALSACGLLYVSKFIHTTITPPFVKATDDKG